MSPWSTLQEHDVRSKSCLPTVGRERELSALGIYEKKKTKIAI